MHLSTTVLMVSLTTFASTLLGGLFALRMRDRLHLILGFSGGAVLGVALFDLIPRGHLFGRSSLQRSGDDGCDRGGLSGLHGVRSGSCNARPSKSPNNIRNGAVLGAGSLCVHSFLDGFSIGLAFKVSASVGAIVTAAVLVHDFSDGINTVSLILKNRGSDRSAFRWLVVDAAAPIIGAASTMIFTLQAAMLGLGLAAMAGFFLYIGASDLLPESYHDHPTVWTTAMTILGASTMFVAIRLAIGWSTI